MKKFTNKKYIAHAWTLLINVFSKVGDINLYNDHFTKRSFTYTPPIIFFSLHLWNTGSFHLQLQYQRLILMFKIENIEINFIFYIRSYIGFDIWLIIRACLVRFDMFQEKVHIFCQKNRLFLLNKEMKHHDSVVLFLNKYVKTNIRVSFWVGLGNIWDGFHGNLLC